MRYEPEREQLCKIIQMLFARGLASGADGNMSLRTPGGEMLVTPSGVGKAFLTPGQLLLQGMDGGLIEGEGKPTRESAFHSALYTRRPEIHAVLHTHSPFATALANLGGPLPRDILVEVPLLLGQTGWVPFAPPGSETLAKGVAANAAHSIILLQNHGVIVAGKTLQDAYNLLDSLENAAKTLALGLLLPGTQRIPPHLLAQL